MGIVMRSDDKSAEEILVRHRGRTGKESQLRETR